jgi:CDP-diacylglycerol--glycerol-3-phosphate 3-phosphatidyltransferase
MTMDSRWLRRYRILDAGRGLVGRSGNPGASNDIAGSSGGTTNDTIPLASRKRPLRHPLPAFPLESRHFGDLLSKSPHEFHSTLCTLIRNAKERVYIASLYVGPAACPNQQKEEVELLTALSEASDEGVSIKVVLDQNRALRPVPVQSVEEKVTTTTSSAEAVSNAIQRSIYLFQVLPSPLDRILPNPLNEVAGVFHIKIYVIDDQLILSGANLANEYFCDRLDRYLQICEGGNGLVDFYATLVDILCRHSQVYGDGKDGGRHRDKGHTRISKHEFLREVTKHFQDLDPVPAKDLFEPPSSSCAAPPGEIVAVAIPTFHAPRGFWSETADLEYLTDIEATLSLLEEGSRNSEQDSEDECGYRNTHTNSTYSMQPPQVQLSSAYLNPTVDLLDVLSKYPQVELLTAGRLSHGFKPKAKAGNKGKDWIPTVFDHLADTSLLQLPGAKLYHWERPGWTFHGKGIWIRECCSYRMDGDPCTGDVVADVAAAVVGSSNFGGRSFERDMESNLLLVFPPSISSTESSSSSSGTKSVASHFGQEWTDLLSSSTCVDPKEVVESAPPLPWYIRLLFPITKTFF